MCSLITHSVFIFYDLLICECILSISKNNLDYFFQRYLSSYIFHSHLSSMTTYSVQFSCSVVSNSLWDHGLQHSRLPCPWDSPGQHWSRLPFPSPMHESEKWKWSRSVMSDSSRPHELQPTRLLRPWDFPVKSIGVEVPLASLGGHHKKFLIAFCQTKNLTLVNFFENDVKLDTSHTFYHTIIVWNQNAYVPTLTTFFISLYHTA